MIFCFFSSRRRHTRCALVTGVQTCALPIYPSATGRARPRPGADKHPRMAEAPMLVPHEPWNREGWRPATPPLQSLAMVWSSFGLDIAAREIFEQLTNSFLGAVRLANITAHGTVGIEPEQIPGLQINQ